MLKNLKKKKVAFMKRFIKSFLFVVVISFQGAHPAANSSSFVASYAGLSELCKKIIKDVHAVGLDPLLASDNQWVCLFAQSVNEFVQSNACEDLILLCKKYGIYINVRYVQSRVHLDRINALADGSSHKRHHFEVVKMPTLFEIALIIKLRGMGLGEQLNLFDVLINVAV